MKCLKKKKKRRGGRLRRPGGGESKENVVTALGKFKVTASNTAAGSGSGVRRRNFAASRPCVCARGSASECARVAGRAPERDGWGWGGGGAGRGRGEGGGASAKLPGGKDFAALGPLCTAARPPRPASDPPSVDAAAGAAAHSPRKGSVEPPEIFPNDRSRSAANSSFLFWALFPLPLSLSFLEKLAS